MDFRKILVAVDSSDNSARAVEYTATMINSSPDFRVSLVYVEHLPERDIYPDEQSWLQACGEEKNKVKDFLAQAEQTLVENGVRPENIGTRYVTAQEQAAFAEDVRGRGVAFHLMRIQKEGGFGTVAVGRRGVSKAQEFLFGSVSTRIIHHIENCTVWVVE